MPYVDGLAEGFVGAWGRVEEGGPDEGAENQEQDWWPPAHGGVSVFWLGEAHWGCWPRFG